MKTRLALLALPLFALAACRDNRASIQAQAICAPTTDCTFAATCGAQYIGFPTLDTTASATDTFWIFLQVANQLPDNTNAAIGKANTNNAHIDETAVEYDGIALPGFTTSTNFSVPAGGTAVISILVIPATYSAVVSAVGTAAGTAGSQIIALVRLRGYFDDGTRFETDDFPVAVKICSGCVGASCGGFPTCPPDSEGQLPVTCL